MTAALLACESLTMRFGGLLAVDRLTFALRPGDIHGLIGPNGAGKTTLFNVISGYYKPSGGRVLFRGEDIAGLKMHAVAARGLTRTFQHSSLFNELTVLENVLVGFYLPQKPTLLDALLRRRRAAEARIAAKARALLDFFGLADRQHERAAQLPHGLQRALGIAIAMAPAPALLMLDEPFTGMNAEETENMMALARKIRDSGTTLLLVEHDMRAVLGLCDKITVINFGRVLTEGSAEDIVHHPQVVEAYLGSQAHSYTAAAAPC